MVKISAGRGAQAARGSLPEGRTERTAAATALLDATVRALFGLSWGQARDAIASGKVAVDGARGLEPTARVRAGATVALDPRARKPSTPGALPREAVVYLDAHVIVVRKPAGVSTVPYEGPDATSVERHTLDEQVRTFLSRLRDAPRGGPAALGVVHRIDKETSGLVVFTRTWLAKKGLAAQFRAHTVHRRYLAIAHGRVPKTTFRTHLVDNRGDGLRGSRELGRRANHPGQLAVTHVEPLEALSEGGVEATLVACTLETGRTHQIRIHLSEAGHPLLGERVYVRRYPGPLLPAPRLMLHAAELGFVHPATNRPMRWEEEPPEDFRAVLARLRR